jgi:hypothetical protein
MTLGPLEDFFDEHRYDVLLPSSACWVLEELIKLTTHPGFVEVIRDVWVVYGTLLLKHEDGDVLFAARAGKRPMPVHILNPEAMVELPREADQARKLLFPVSVNNGDREWYEELMRAAQVSNMSDYTSKALFMYYDLLLWQIRGDQFFEREQGVSELRRVEIFGLQETDTEEGE